MCVQAQQEETAQRVSWALPVAWVEVARAEQVEPAARAATAELAAMAGQVEMAERVATEGLAAPEAQAQQAARVARLSLRGRVSERVSERVSDGRGSVLKVPSGGGRGGGAGSVEHTHIRERANE